MRRHSALRELRDRRRALGSRLAPNATQANQGYKDQIAEKTVCKLTQTRDKKGRENRHYKPLQHHYKGKDIEQHQLLQHPTVQDARRS